MAIILKKNSSTLATILLITMLLSVIAPATTLAASTDSTTSAMHKTEDVFGGSFSPREVVAASGETFDVTFSLLPTMDIPDAVISFVLPADLVKLTSGSQVWTGDLKKGESLTLTLSLATNGEVAAYVRADVEASPSGKNYRSSYYLHVATSSTGFNPSAASGSIEYGSLRSVNLEYVSAAPSTESSRAPENPQAPQSTSGTIEVKGRFVYLNEDGGYSPARYMKVRLRDNNDAAWSVIRWTNGTGYFDFIVANSAGGRSPILDLIAEGEWDWKTLDYYGAQYWWSTDVLATNVSDGWVYTYYELSPINNNDALQAGDAVYAEAQWIYDWTGWSRSKVIIHWPSGIWAHSHGDSIDLPLKTTGAWDHVTVQHEEGHCVMWALYGSWPSGSGPSPHYIWSESSQGFAFLEGWAEFMMCAVDNNASNWVDYYNGHGGNMETNDWFNCQTNANMDGAIIEGSIASILWDINDPVNITGDNDHMAWGFDEIFTVMQNDKPQNMPEFWDDWSMRWPDNSTSKGPLCDIYYHYGIDKDWFNPWGSVIINGGAAYTTNRTVTLTLNGDDWGAGVYQMRFSENTGTWGPWIAYSTTYSYTLTSVGDGSKSVNVQFKDYAGQNSTMWGIWDYIYLDTTLPNGTIIINNGNPTYTTTTNVTLYLTYFDATSGVYQVRYGNSGGSWSVWEAPAATNAWNLTSGDGSKTVYYQVMDNAGLISSTYSATIIVDSVAPTGSIVINGGGAYTTSTSVTLTLSYLDGGSGVSQVRFSNDGVWDTEAWESASATRAWTLTSGDGTKTVYYQNIDNAGQVSAPYYSSITLDTTAPTANAGQSQTVTQGNSVTFDASGSVDSTGVVSYIWDFGDDTQGSGITTTHTYSSLGTYVATLTVKDSAGNNATTTVNIIIQPQPTPTPSPTAQPTATPHANPTPTPSPTASPSQTASPSPSTEPTTTQPTEKPPMLLIIIVAGVAAFAIIGAALAINARKKKS